MKNQTIRKRSLVTSSGRMRKTERMRRAGGRKGGKRDEERDIANRIYQI